MNDCEHCNHATTDLLTKSYSLKLILPLSSLSAANNRSPGYPSSFNTFNSLFFPVSPSTPLLDLKTFLSSFCLNLYFASSSSSLLHLSSSGSPNPFVRTIPSLAPNLYSLTNHGLEIKQFNPNTSRD